MKKNKKVKAPKSSKKNSKVEEPPLPSLVEAMAKLVERLEFVERKMDQVLGRVSNLPSEMRNAVQQASRPGASHQMHPAPVSQYTPSAQPQEGRKERTMYQAICADCRKNCEVPFKPGDRPIYCKECFVIRKAGYRPQDPDKRTPLKTPSYVPSALSSQAIPTLPKNTSVFPTRTLKHKSGAKAKKKKK